MTERPPSFYTAEIAARILGELSGGRSLRAVCRDHGMPPYRTVRIWIQEDRDGFAARYRQARTVDKSGGLTLYTAEIAERILEQLSVGRTLTEICHDPGMPSSCTARRWVIDDREGFAARYRQARETGRAKPGPRSTFTAEMAEWILDELSDGRTLAEVCRDYGMPGRGTVRHWVKLDLEGFASRFREAREFGYEAMAEDIVDIADNGVNDWTARCRPDGTTEYALDQEHISRSRMRISSRRWTLAKALPRRYGDKPDPNAGTYDDDLAEMMRMIDGRTRGLPSEDIPYDPDNE
jgi:transposase-like protein